MDSSLIVEDLDSIISYSWKRISKIDSRAKSGRHNYKDENIKYAQ